MRLTAPDVAEMEYIAGMTFEDYLCQMLTEQDFKDFAQGIAFYFKNILRGVDDDLGFSDDLLTFNAPNRQYELDLNFRNIILRNGDFVLFDYEFMFPTLPKKFVAWRAFKVFCHNCAALCQKHSITEESLGATLQLPAEILAEYALQDRAIIYALQDAYEQRYRKGRFPVKNFKFD